MVLDPVLLSRSGTIAAYGAGTSSQSNYFGIFSTEPSSKSLAPMTTCQDHDFTKMKPLVLATWKHGFQVSPKETILLEIQFLGVGERNPGGRLLVKDLIDEEIQGVH